MIFGIILSENRCPLFGDHASILQQPLDAGGGRRVGDDLGLQIDLLGKLIRAARTHDLTGRADPGGRAPCRSPPQSHRRQSGRGLPWKLLRAEQADQPIHREPGVPASRAVGTSGSIGARSLLATQYLHFAGLHLRPHDRVGRDVKLDAAFGEIVDRLHAVAIRHLGDVDIRRSSETATTKSIAPVAAPN